MMKYCIYILFLILCKDISAQEIVNTSLSSCDEKSNPIYIRNRLIEKEIKQDTLFLNVGLILNCCITPNPILTYKNDTLFLEIANTSDLWCACECCFELKIEATGIPDTNFILMLQSKANDITNEGFIDRTKYREIKQYKNKYIFPSIEELEVNDEFDQTDSSGLKSGIRYVYFDNSEKLKYKIVLFINEKQLTQTRLIVKYNEDGDTVEICSVSEENELICIDWHEYNLLMNDKSSGQKILK